MQLSQMRSKKLVLMRMSRLSLRSGRESLHYIFGKTYAGRYLFIVVKFIRPGEVKVITARDMNAWEKNYFKKRGK